MVQTFSAAISNGILDKVRNHGKIGPLLSGLSRAGTQHALDVLSNVFKMPDLFNRVVAAHKQIVFLNLVDACNSQARHVAKVGIGYGILDEADSILISENLQRLLKKNDPYCDEIIVAIAERGLLDRLNPNQMSEFTLKLLELDEPRSSTLIKEIQEAIEIANMSHDLETPSIQPNMPLSVRPRKDLSLLAPPKGEALSRD